MLLRPGRRPSRLPPLRSGVAPQGEWLRINLALRDAVRVMPGGRGECGACGRSLISSASRAARASCLPALRPAREVRHWTGKAKAGNARLRTGLPREPGLGCALGDVSPLGKSRGGTPAGERARERTGRRKPLLPWRDPRAVFACGRCYPRLPAFRFPYFLFSYFVIAGLDPAIRAAKRLIQLSALLCRCNSAWTTGSGPVVTRSMASLFDNTRARLRRENKSVLFDLMIMARANIIGWRYVAEETP